jgi:uncharacterized protein YjbI with pentapeptide repeats
MKKSAALLLLMIASTLAFAQTRIKASDIIRQINAGQAVEYTNAEIEGDLDLTDLNNSRPERGSSFFYFGSTQTFESSVRVPLKFTNCTFLGEVLAYYHLERRNETYVAHFERDVAFTNCTFRKGSEFKYSEFNGSASFAGSTFHREANFKYAEFSTGPSFSLARFEEGANFKYAEFPRETSFAKAVFNGRTDFKYTKFRSPLNMDGVAFRGSEDFKYTKIDGRSFTAYLLNR